MSKRLYHAELVGARLVNAVSEGVHFVVKGMSPSAARIEKAKELGIKVIEEKEYFELVAPEIWREYEMKLAAEAEQAEKRRLEAEKRHAEYLKAWETKRATMPRTRVMADVLREPWGVDSARLISREEYLNLTADELREAIDNGENEPVVARDQDGACFLLNAIYRGWPSHNVESDEREA
jgi:hypothetical protein